MRPTAIAIAQNTQGAPAAPAWRRCGMARVMCREPDESWPESAAAVAGRYSRKRYPTPRTVSTRLPDLAELPPQRHDLHVHRSVGDGGEPVVDRFDDLLAGEHAAGPAAPAARSSLNSVAVRSIGLSAMVKACRSASIRNSPTSMREPASGSLLGPAAEHGPDARREHAGAEGLGDVVVGAHLEAADDVALLPLGREHDHGDRRGLRPRLERATDLQTVHAREHQVEQHEVGLLVADQTQRLLAGHRREDVVALLGEVVPHQFEQVLLILHNEHAGRPRRSIPCRLRLKRGWLVIIEEPCERGNGRTRHAAQCPAPASLIASA